MSTVDEVMHALIPGMRWTDYAAGSSVDHFAWWCHEHCEQSVDEFDGLPLDLEPFQLDVMGEALAVDENDTFVWQSVALVLPRKNGKTQLLAAYALYRLVEFEGSPEVLLAASSDKQAGRLFDAAVAMVRRSGFLADRLHLREHIGEIARRDGRGKMVRLASNPNATHGYNPSLVVCDELHAWTTPNMRKTWAALTTGGGARKAPQVFTITTAGEAQERETSILGRLVDRNETAGVVEKPHPGLTISRNEAARTLVYNYSAPTTDSTDVDALAQANPASWITVEFLARQAANPELSPGEVLQLHGCVWSDAIGAWIGPSEWSPLADELVADGPGVAPVFFGADGARTGDCTALAHAWMLEDGRVAVRAHVWAAHAGARAHEYLPGKIDNRALVPVLVHQRDEEGWNVEEVVYDPRYLDTVAEMLSDLGFVVADAWSSTSEQAKAWQAWIDAVRTGMVVHDGDAVLAAHVCAAQAKLTDTGWKVSKLSQRKKIDALVACAMAHWRCVVASRSSGAWAEAW